MLPHQTSSKNGWLDYSSCIYSGTALSFINLISYYRSYLYQHYKHYKYNSRTPIDPYNLN